MREYEIEVDEKVTRTFVVSAVTQAEALAAVKKVFPADKNPSTGLQEPEAPWPELDAKVVARGGHYARGRRQMHDQLLRELAAIDADGDA